MSFLNLKGMVRQVAKHKGKLFLFGFVLFILLINVFAQTANAATPAPTTPGTIKSTVDISKNPDYVNTGGHFGGSSTFTKTNADGTKSLYYQSTNGDGTYSYIPTDTQNLTQAGKGPSTLTTATDINGNTSTSVRGNVDSASASADPSCWKEGGSWYKLGWFDAGGCAAWFGNLILSFMSWILYIVGIIFNYVMNYTVVNMSLNLFGANGNGGITGINETWTTFRDLANIFFIFILLAISISTILRVGGYDAKSLLIKLIVVAILMNFSMFFTKIIIDASNIVSLQFYKTITVGGTPIGQSTDPAKGLADAFLETVHLTTIYTGNSSATSGNTAIGATQANNGLGWYKIFITTIFGSILILVAALVFLAATWIFIVRFITIVILMILSPIAFAAMVLPSTKKTFDKWKDKLIAEALVSPAFFIMIWVTLKVANSESFKAISRTGSFANLASADAGSAGILFNYAIVLGLLVASLLLAKETGGAGAAVASGFVTSTLNQARGGMQGYMGRGIARTALAPVGWAAKGLGMDENSAFGKSRIGTKLRSITTDKVKDAKFGSGRSITDVNKTNKTIDDNYTKFQLEGTEKKFDAPIKAAQAADQEKSDRLKQRMDVAGTQKAQMESRGEDTTAITNHINILQTRKDNYKSRMDATKAQFGPLSVAQNSKADKLEAGMNPFTKKQRKDAADKLRALARENKRSKSIYGNKKPTP